MNNHGKGNRKAQRKRRKERFKKQPKRKDKLFFLIDGNESYYPCAFCHYHKAFLTQGLMDLHSCLLKKCPRLRMLDDQ